MQTTAVGLAEAWEDGALVAIHYACEDLSRVSGRSARVACIVTSRIDSEDTKLFSLASGADEASELAMLESFFAYAEHLGDANWVHWNMSSAKYGFDSLAARLVELRGKPDGLTEIPLERRFDLDKIVEELRGRPLEVHPKFFSLAKMNGLTPHRALAGAAEAGLVDEEDWSPLEDSVEEKVKWLVTFVRRILAGSLVIEEPDGETSNEHHVDENNALVKWSLLREALISMTFNEMKQVAAKAGLETVRLSHLKQQYQGGASKSQLADGIDDLFMELTVAEQVEVTSQMIVLLLARHNDEKVDLLRRSLSGVVSPPVIPRYPPDHSSESVDDELPITISQQRPSMSAGHQLSTTSTDRTQSVKVFVSHAKDDSLIADSFVRNILLLGLGLEVHEIAYTSMAETGIPGSAQWFTWIETSLHEAELVVALVTDTFLTRQLCLLEAGAAWHAGKLMPVQLGDDRGELGQLQFLDGRSVETLDQLGLQIATRIACEQKAPRWAIGRSGFLADVTLVE